MSNFDSSNSSGDRSGRSQAEKKQAQLLSDLAKSLDTQHHNTSLMHEFGGAFEAPGAVTPSSSGTGTVGQAPSPARSDHQHGAEIPTWIYPALVNGWANYGAGWQTTRYCKISGIIFMQGLLTAGTMGAAMFTLQVSYRPQGHIMVTAPAAAAASVGRLNIMSDGTVYAEPGWGNNTYYSITCSFWPGV